MNDLRIPLFPEEDDRKRQGEPLQAPTNTLGEGSLRTLLALASLKGVGKGAIIGLYRVLGGIDEVWRADKVRLESVLRSAKVPRYKTLAEEILEKKELLLEEGEKRWERLRKRGVHFVWGNELPAPLRGIPDAPPWLFVEGDPRALYSRPAVAVVGTRRPSEKGRAAAKKVVRLLAAYRISVVSGLAEGIDAEVHAEALEESLTNVAFLGHGINVIFPKQTQRLREQIVESGGAIASEYLPDEKYNKAYFVQRNRLQAALSDLVIPVEASAQSGTAHTVRFAIEYQRPLVGLAWKGANGIHKLVREAGYPVVPVFNSQGLRQLDRAFQNLVWKAGRHPDPTSRAIKRLVSELSSRCLTEKDVDVFWETLRTLMKIVEEDGCTQSR